MPKFSFIKNRRAADIITIVLAMMLLLCIAGFFLFRMYESQSTGLKGFTTLTKQDPLFYSPFPDAHSYQNELETLQNAEEELLAISIKNIEDTGIRSEVYLPIFATFTLFPYDFLYILPDISLATEQFFDNPTEERANELISLYELALQGYDTAIDSHIIALEELFKHFTPEELGYYFFVDSGTSVELVYEDFKIIEKNADALRQEITLRKECLKGNIGCTGLIKKGHLHTVTAETLSPDVDTINQTRAEIVRNNMSYQDSIEQVTGPYAIFSECWFTGSDTPYDTMYLYTYEDSEDIFKVMPKLADETYYAYVALDPVRQIDKYLREKGVDYVSQLEATMYQCPDLSYYPVILTADYITQLAKQTKKTPTALLSEGQNQRLLENMFGLLAPAYDVVANNLNLLRDTQRLTTDNIISPQHLLSTRSAYSLVFMPYARSVWRTEEKPIYFLPRDNNLIERLRMDHIRLSELVNMGYTNETIAPLHFTQVDYVTELLEREEN